MLKYISQGEDKIGIEISCIFIDSLFDCGKLVNDKIWINHVLIVHYKSIKNLFPRRNTIVRNSLEPFSSTLFQGMNTIVHRHNFVFNLILIGDIDEAP